MKKTWFKYIIPPAVVLLIIGGIFAVDYFGLIPEKTYTAADFGITTVKSSVDFNQNGMDDYTDLMAGARLDAQNRPRYNGAYYETGYPPEDVGVCTDLVWRAFRNAGYSLKDMVDADIVARPEAYPKIENPDPNIDFRRVGNLLVFLEAYGTSLTTDIHQIEAWQPGDIVVFRGTKHIGIVSDLRNEDGQPYILHNGGQYKREEDYLPGAEVTAHFRFDASKIPAEVLVVFEEGAA
ncbi:MAG: DUF1287 domain-containing protein [Clostridia bacterium]|nr:DUF1287 domain-containing protein [Clostridia bacterium]